MSYSLLYCKVYEDICLKAVYCSIVVIKSFEVEASTIASAFGQIDLGTLSVGGKLKWADVPVKEVRDEKTEFQATYEYTKTRDLKKVNTPVFNAVYAYDADRYKKQTAERANTLLFRRKLDTALSSYAP